MAQNKVDAAIGWNTFPHLAAGRLEVVETPPHEQVWRGTGVALLATATRVDEARRLMDFLITPEARACYAKYGFAACRPKCEWLHFIMQ